MAHRMLVFMVLALASPVLAVEPYRDGRVRLVEDGVVLQRASEAGAEQAIQNLPFLPGDRVWTDESGRVEFQFADGSVLRVDRRSKLDYVAQEAGPDGDRIALRLWAGALQLQAWDTRDYPDFEISCR